MTNRKLFVNMAVKDLNKSVSFFTELGFTFDSNFTDENATCMIIGEDAYAMLLTEPFFRGFTKNEICDTRTHTESLFAFSCESRAEVDTLADRALSIGATPCQAPQDQGFMYGRSFYDLDGHHWELIWMDMGAIPAV